MFALGSIMKCPGTRLDLLPSERTTIPAASPVNVADYSRLLFFVARSTRHSFHISIIGVNRSFVLPFRAPFYILPGRRMHIQPAGDD